jgi:hypothetical protein
MMVCIVLFPDEFAIFGNLDTTVVGRARDCGIRAVRAKRFSAIPAGSWEHR